MKVTLVKSLANNYYSTEVKTEFPEQEEELIEKFGDTEKLLILKKPFDSIEVRQMAITMTEKWGLAKENLQYINNLQTLLDEQNSELKKIVDMVDASDKDAIRSAIQALIDKNSQESADIQSVPATE